MTLELLTVALRFSVAGYCVLPVAPDGTKRPNVKTWTAYQTIAPRTEDLQGWFNGPVNNGIGLVTGRVSGNLEMLELEGRAVESGVRDAIEQMAKESGLGELWQRINDGYTELTPSGGIHWLYRISDGPVAGNTKLARRAGANDTVEVLAETRGEGGFVVIAPTGGHCHPSGRGWVQVSGSAETIASVTSSEREDLHALFKYFDSLPRASEALSAARTVPAAGEGQSPGDAFNAQSTWDEILLPLGWTKLWTKAGVTHWRRPGKREGISATTNFENTDYFYPFSTSTSFEAERGYSKFAVYALTAHNGDFTLAAAALKARGFGSGKVSNLQAFDISALETTQSGNTGQDPTEAGDVERTESASAWLPRPLDLDAEDEPAPQILFRTDGSALLYAGKINALFGESESGKTWIALEAVRQELQAGHPVFYLDFEDSGRGIANRLKAMGVARNNFSTFRYANPDGLYDMEAQAALLPLIRDVRPTLIVVDGVNAAMNLLGLDLDKNKDATQFSQVVLRPLRLWGAAVLTIDHVTKSKDSRGNYAIGAQAKRADIDGVALMVEVEMPFGRGTNGKLKLKITKDRPGHVRGMALEASFLGHAELNSGKEGGVQVLLPSGITPMISAKEYIMEAISKFMAGHGQELSANKIGQAVEGKTDNIRMALVTLGDRGYLDVRTIGKANYYSHRKPFVAGVDPVPLSFMAESVQDSIEFSGLEG
ncbi:AAA domain containing protein [uncultured Caudovirales phage]|uniref:AAA domain containing protein n=1 Tax=uncultured Caudovirales phage TaxID=2100421 RepID=A0A6J5SKT8_9CAUD|nr:AAA domain containing protein [uncultured Caudovirales phage]CAB4219647.1 AAA domain containing protein [uncultured Caudovirales phage]